MAEKILSNEKMPFHWVSKEEKRVHFLTTLHSIVRNYLLTIIHPGERRFSPAVS